MGSKNSCMKFPSPADTLLKEDSSSMGTSRASTAMTQRRLKILNRLIRIAMVCWRIKLRVDFFWSLESKTLKS